MWRYCHRSVYFEVLGVDVSIILWNTDLRVRRIQFWLIFKRKESEKSVQRRQLISDCSILRLKEPQILLQISPKYNFLTTSRDKGFALKTISHFALTPIMVKTARHSTLLLEVSTDKMYLKTHNTSTQIRSETVRKWDAKTVKYFRNYIDF